MRKLQGVTIDKACWPRIYKKLRQAGFGANCKCGGCASCQQKARNFIHKVAQGSQYVGKYRPKKWDARYSVYVCSTGKLRVRLIIDMAGKPAVVDILTDRSRHKPLDFAELNGPTGSLWEGEQSVISRINVKLRWHTVAPSAEVPLGVHEPVVYILAKRSRKSTSSTEPGLWLLRKVGETGDLSSLRSRYRTVMRDDGNTLFYSLLTDYPDFRGRAKNRYRLDLEKIISRTLVRAGLRFTHHHDTSQITEISHPIHVENPLPTELLEPAGYSKTFSIDLTPGQAYEMEIGASGYTDPRWAIAIDARPTWPGGTSQKEKLKRIPSTIRNHPAKQWQGPLTFQQILTNPTGLPKIRGLYFIVWPHGAYLGMSAEQGDGIRGRVVDHIREHQQFTFRSTSRGLRNQIRVYWLNLDRMKTKTIENMEKAYLNSIIGVNQDTNLSPTWDRRKKYLAAGFRNMKEFEAQSFDDDSYY